MTFFAEHEGFRDVMHPFVASLDDDVIRAQLRRLAQRFLDE